MRYGHHRVRRPWPARRSPSRPRVRRTDGSGEVPLETYVRLQSPDAMPQAVFRRMARGVSTRDYANVIDLTPESFGVKKSAGAEQPACGLEPAGRTGGDASGGPAGRAGGAAADAGHDRSHRVGTVGDAPGHGAGDALAGRGAAAAVVRGGPAARRAPVPPGQGHRALPTLIKALEASTRARRSGIEHGVA
jgi:hypothetical protein